MPRILVIRFSALGDVAMTVPVVHALATQYPQAEITVLSREAFRPLFAALPANVCFEGADLKGTHKGIRGLNALFRELRNRQFDAVADLHDVLRSQYLRLRFRLAGASVTHIDKGRAGKRKLVRRTRKVLRQQKTSFARYAEVLARLGYPVQLQFRSLFEKEHEAVAQRVEAAVGAKGGQCWIGIAPFAKHAGKIYPAPLLEKVIGYFSSRPDTRLFLFGGGKEEERQLKEWEEKYPGTLSVAGKFKLDGELELMHCLDVMVSMDSGNMHLASLVGTPVVSIWGATHPYAGFLGWNQQADNVVQLDLPCRPCSVFGQKPCYKGDYPCLNIAPETVIGKVEQQIQTNKQST